MVSLGMTKLERTIQALEALPAERQEELMDSIIREAEALSGGAEGALTEEDWAEIDRRRARGFRPAEPDALAKLKARFE